MSLLLTLSITPFSSIFIIDFEQVNVYWELQLHSVDPRERYDIYFIFLDCEIPSYYFRIDFSVGFTFSIMSYLKATEKLSLRKFRPRCGFKQYLLNILLCNVVNPLIHNNVLK